MNSSLNDISDIETLTHLAISAAAFLNWPKAVKINQQILKIEKENVEAINRLAKAFNCLGKTKESQKLYKKVLEIDPYNIIAQKNLEKITKSNNSSRNGKTTPVQEPIKNTNFANFFLFEPGITKLISLLNLAPPQILATLNCGDEVLLNPKKHSVTVVSLEKIYLGALPDDFAYKLITFLEGGNKYTTHIKCASTKNLTVFIREVYRSEKFATQPSFTLSQNPYLEK